MRKRWRMRLVIVAFLALVVILNVLLFFRPARRWTPLPSLPQLAVLDASAISESDLAAWVTAELAALRTQPDARLLHLSRCFRLYKALAGGRPTALAAAMERDLFNFIAPTRSLAALKASYAGRGIVITASRHQLRFLYPLLHTLRFNLSCTLPVELVFKGEADLLPSEQASVRNWVPGLRVVDVAPLLSDEARGVQGYGVKMLALLFASCDECVLIDADAVLLVDPATFFTDVRYGATGTLFFYDYQWDKKPKDLRPVFRDWLDAFMPDLAPDSTAHGPDFLGGLSGMLLESGVVVMHKRRRFVSVLAQATLVLPRFADLFATRVLGDKELFWMAAHMAKEPIGVYPGVAGRIGEPHPGFPRASEPCGNHIAHESEDGVPLWFNGGIYADKVSSAAADEIGVFTHFSRYMPHAKMGVRHGRLWCVVMLAASTPVCRPVPPAQRAIIAYHAAQALRMRESAAALGVPLSLPARSHGLEAVYHGSNWAAYKERCARETAAMRAVA